MKSYFEPTGRLIMSIGKDLIKDLPAALVELVKNSYDADASNVKITYSKHDKFLELVVEDDGHGMSEDTILTAWMVPSTDYKLKNKMSPKGRVYQGQKGIGRYAVSLLGNKLQLITVKDGTKTTANFNWDDFNSEKKLSDIPIEITSNETDENSGTKLIITNEYDNKLIEQITEKDAIKIEKELSKLLFGVKNFKIIMEYKNFFNDKKLNNCKELSQIDLNDSWHYKLSGKVYSDFSYDLNYRNFYTSESKNFKGNFNDGLVENLSSCGVVNIDYRVYDKDSTGIEVIMNFVNDNKNTNLTKREVMNLLTDQSGISIYRNDFRIRPYGDKGFDWLNLDKKRVQNPRFAIGSEQISGRISIESEINSGLKEKSARDGLYENSNFDTLCRIAVLSLNILERERFNYRHQKSNIDRKKKDVENLLDFSKLEQNINLAIENYYSNLTNSYNDVNKIINYLQNIVEKEIKEMKNEKKEELSEAKENISIYQKHATLGNVISVILHESRKPLGWYNTKLPAMRRKINKYKHNNEISNTIYDSISADIERLSLEAKRMSDFYGRLDPLTSNKRKKRKSVNLKKEFEAVVEIFQSKIDEQKIEIQYEFHKDINLNIVEEDLYMALTNIIENAVFWVSYSKHNNKVIKFRALSKENENIIEIIDNGPGISSEDIIDNLIFIPGYSKKNSVLGENGTGLGLSIAGEAIQRNEGSLEAVDFNDGAYFRIIFKNAEV